MKHALSLNGVMIARTATGIAVAYPTLGPPLPNEMLTIELWYAGKLWKRDAVQTYGPPYREYLGKEFDHLRIVIIVKNAVGSVLAELSLPDEEYILPFMVVQGEQRHITESSVSVPPALTLTDTLGAVWTLGFVAAPKERSPEGEYAFAVLRDGIDTGEVASRIEMRGKVVKCFTRHGWKKWIGREWF